jgi:hypothetical protein
MSDQLSESELLAYVEDELDANQVSALRARLAGDRHVLAALDRLREDRALLRSAGEPAPPVDFLTELEPQLARPMLMEQPPGAYRRRHRRRRRRVRWTALAVAAALPVVIFAGVWALLSVGTPADSERPGDAGQGGLAQAPAEGGSGAVASDIGVEPRLADAGEGAWPPAGSVIVHEYPLPAGPRFAMARPTGEAERPFPPTEDGAGSRAAMVSAVFALVVPAGNVPDGERIIRQAVEAFAASGDEPAEPSVALVRNFTYAEARMLVDRYYQPMPADPSPPDRYAAVGDEADRSSVSLEERQRQYRRLAQMIRELRTRHRPDEEALFSTQLIGPDRLAASYERQLSFSSRGATHTITIPAASLAEMLTRLYQADGASTTLRLLPPEDPRQLRAGAGPEGELGAASLRQQAEDYRSIRRFIDQLREDADYREAYVLLPVVIETNDDGSRR